MTTTTDQKLDSILQAIKGLEARVTLLESGQGKAEAKQSKNGGATRKDISIKEFLIENPPPTDILRTLAIGYFLENHAGMALFTRADLEKGYSDAKESTPSNISVNIARCIKSGHMMEAREKKDNKTAYVLTRSGEQFVAAKFKKGTTDS